MELVHWVNFDISAEVYEEVNAHKCKTLLVKLRALFQTFISKNEYTRVKVF
jgi:hypothetical protein